MLACRSEGRDQFPIENVWSRIVLWRSVTAGDLASLISVFSDRLGRYPAGSDKHGVFTADTMPARHPGQGRQRVDRWKRPLRGASRR